MMSESCFIDECGRDPHVEMSDAYTNRELTLCKTHIEIVLFGEKDD